MNKKLLTTLGVSALLLAACGGTTEEDTVEETAQETNVEETAEAEEVQTEDATNNEAGEESEGLAEGETEESEYGTMTRVVAPFEVNETQQSGPFDVTVLQAQAGQIQPSEDYIDIFGGEDVGIISLQIEVTNNSEDTNMIYPDQGTVVTDTGHQIDSDLLFSGDVGGDFFGEVTKTGEVWFMYEGDVSEVSNIRYIVDGAHDENFENIGEDLEFSIDY